jgi:CubicO group peptidase (beta-lactamase class C family)
MTIFRTVGLAALALSIAAPAWAQGLPKAQSPEEVGFSAARLKLLSARINEGVKAGELPGAVVLISRNGKIVLHEAYGFRDKDAKAPMKTDTIFRIASMTKPIVAVATLMLMEEGKLSLADPVSKYIPAFADTKVAVTKKNDDGTEEIALEPQIRPMTVQDLMRHTSGLTYGSAESRNKVKQSYMDMKVMVPDQTNAEMVEKLAKLALLYQPGTHWEYSMAIDVLGRVVEVASGLTLDKFIEERITRPLKMVDSGFDAAPEKKDRSARPQKEGKKNEMPVIPDITLKTAWKSGGGGMVSTSADYARFAQMLANGGQLDGVRLLSRKSVELMTSNHLPPDIQMGEDMHTFEALEPSARMGQGFGLTVAVRTDAGRNPLPGSVGDYYWGGAYGTYFWEDPHEHLYVIFMMQSQTARLPYRYLMRDMVYQALTGN